MRGIRVVAPGRPINAIGRVIEAYARRFGYGVVRDFTGHGIAEVFHSGLHVPHYDDPRLTTTMEVGMTFTIEPMITLGTHEYDMWSDGWTAVTKDRRWTAQFEHTLVVTEDGCEIDATLTDPSDRTSTTAPALATTSNRRMPHCRQLGSHDRTPGRRRRARCADNFRSHRADRRAGCQCSS